MVYIQAAVAVHLHKYYYHRSCVYCVHRMDVDLKKEFIQGKILYYYKESTCIKSSKHTASSAKLTIRYYIYNNDNIIQISRSSASYTYNLMLCS